MTVTSPETTDTAAPSARLRPVYTRVQAAGLVLAALTPLTFLVLGIAAGLPIAGELPFFGAALAIPLIAAALVWRFGTWAKIVGLVASLLAAGALFWAAFGLAYPQSFADFAGGTFFVAGLVLGLGGGIAALVQKRRGRLESTATAGEQRILAVALAIVLLAGLGSGIANLVARSSPAGGADVAATMRDFEFTPATYEVAAGQATTIEVTNRDPFLHTFTIPDLGIDVALPGGASEVVEVTAPAGTYTIYCTPHSNLDEPDPGEAGMAAQLIAN